MLRNSPPTRFVSPHARGSEDAYRSEQVEPAASVDFGFVARVIRRRIKLIVLVIVASLFVGGLVLMSEVPEYTSTAKIVFERRSVDALRQDSVLTNTSLNSSELDGFMQVLASGSLISEAVQKFGLLHDPELLTTPASDLKRFVASGLTLVGLGDLGLSVGRSSDGREPATLEAVVEKVQESLEVESVGLGYVISISVTLPYRELAARVANAIAQTYIDYRLDQRTSEAEATSQWFDEQLSQLRKKADDADSELSQFKVENQIVDAGRDGLLNEQQLASQNAQLSIAVQASQSARDSLDRINSIDLAHIADAPIGNSPEDVILRQLRDASLALSSELAAAITTYGKDHEVVAEIRDQLNALSPRIADELSRQKALAMAAYNQAVAGESRLRDQLETLTLQASSVSSALVKAKALESEASVYHGLYDTYLQRYLQTKQLQTFPTSDARIISTAMPSEKDGLGIRTALTISLAIGASLGLAGAFIRERMDRTIRTPWQLSLVTGVPTLGILPAKTPGALSQTHYHALVARAPTTAPPSHLTLRVTDTRYSTVLLDPLSRFTETIRRVKLATDRVGISPCQIVGFVSDTRSEGRTIVAANYAQLLSLSGRRTLLIDMDRRVRLLSRILTPENRAGLFELTAPGAVVNARESIWTDATSSLDVLPVTGSASGGQLTDPLVTSERLVHVLVNLSESYDAIVLDLSPLSESTDAAALADLVSGLILVAEWGKTSSDILAERVAEPRIADKLLGAVISQVDFRKYRKYEVVT